MDTVIKNSFELERCAIEEATVKEKEQRDLKGLKEPSDLTGKVSKLDNDPFGSGGFGDVYIGELRDSDGVVKKVMGKTWAKLR